MPAVTHITSTVKPATHAPALPATHAPASVASNVGVATTLDPNIPVPAHTGPAIATFLNGKPVIKLTNVHGNETTVYYLSSDQKHILSVISSISTVPPQHVATTQPVNQPAAQPGQPSSSGHGVTSTPVSYKEIKDAYGRPMGYVNAQGQSIYFPNGQMPAGFTVGPDNTIQTYVTTTSTPTPPSHPAPAPQPPAPSKPPAASSGHHVTSTPVSYKEIKDAYGRPMGYINAQGLAVYFPNGQMPPGFSVGPNNTIQTYIKSTT